MTTEEKSKRYDEAVKAAESLCKITTSLSIKEYVESIFPELKESKDEKTKKILHSISSKISFHLHDIFTEEEFQCFDAWSNAWLENQGEQKPAWNEEDARLLDNCISLIEDIDCTKEEQNWLKSIKDRYLPQPKQEWGEEDEENLNWFEKFFRAESVVAEGKDIPQDRYLWFKNLKERVQPQNTWKPSVFHLECITDAISMCKERGITVIGLKEILDELKKLKE